MAQEELSASEYPRANNTGPSRDAVKTMRLGQYPLFFLASPTLQMPTTERTMSYSVAKDYGPDFIKRDGEVHEKWV